MSVPTKSVSPRFASFFLILSHPVLADSLPLTIEPINNSFPGFCLSLLSAKTPLSSLIGSSPLFHLSPSSFSTNPLDSYKTPFLISLYYIVQLSPRFFDHPLRPARLSSRIHQLFGGKWNSDLSLRVGVRVVKEDVDWMEWYSKEMMGDMRRGRWTRERE